MSVSTPKSSNQKAVLIGYDILIGCFLSISTKLVLKSFITESPVHRTIPLPPISQSVIFFVYF
jgi:hypothetical protein